MEIRNWREFSIAALKALKYPAFAIALVPIWFLLMMPDLSRNDLWRELWFSTRIGVQIGMFHWACLTAIFAAVFALQPGRLFELRKSVSVQIGLGLGIVMVALGLTSLFEPYISGREFGLDSVKLGFLIGGLTMTVSVLFSAYRKSREYGLRLRAESAEANLNALKHQMQPHFLFNSLNSLAELIECDHEAAATMTQRLADLYREILENSKRPLSTVESEASIVQKYLELEKVRFGSRLHYSLNISEECRRAVLPSLALQTLVENAVKHGVAPSASGGSIDISVINKGDRYFAQVANTGVLMSGSPFDQGRMPKATGTGVQNTKARLDLIYGESHKFGFECDGKQTVASFWITSRHLKKPQSRRQGGSAEGYSPGYVAQGRLRAPAARSARSEAQPTDAGNEESGFIQEPARGIKGV